MEEGVVEMRTKRVFPARGALRPLAAPSFLSGALFLSPGSKESITLNSGNPSHTLS